MSYAGFYADTEITAFKDPDYSDYKIIKVMIAIIGLDLDSKAAAEKIFVKEFNDIQKERKVFYSRKAMDIIAISSLDIYPPTRKYTQEQFNTLIEENEFDSILLIELIDEYSTKTYVPETSYTTETGRIYGNNFNSSSTTVKSGGYYVSKPRIKMDLKIYDTINSKTIWVANTFTKGNGYAEFNDLMKSAAKETVNRLIKDDLFKPKTEPFLQKE